MKRYWKINTDWLQQVTPHACRSPGHPVIIPSTYQIRTIIYRPLYPIWLQLCHQHWDNHDVSDRSRTNQAAGRTSMEHRLNHVLFIYLAYLPHCVSSWSGWNTSCWWGTSIGEAGTRRQERWHAHGSPTEQERAAPRAGGGRWCCCFCLGNIVFFIGCSAVVTLCRPQLQTVSSQMR